MKIAFVTDSTSDIPLSERERLGIEVIPAWVNIQGKSYADGIDISREEFYRRLPRLKPAPTTSSPSAGSFEDCYETLLKSGAEHILSIHAAQNLSGIYNAARLAAQGFKQHVSVVDSGQLSLGLGYQVLMAAEAAFHGSPLQEILTLLQDLHNRVHVAALLESLEYIRRSGRVSWAKAMLGSLFQIQPLVELRYGVVQRLGQARTRAQGIQRLKDALLTWGPMERLAILHTNAEEAARQLLEEVKSKVSTPPFVVNVTTVIGTHVGPGGLGFAGVSVS